MIPSSGTHHPLPLNLPAAGLKSMRAVSTTAGARHFFSMPRLSCWYRHSRGALVSTAFCPLSLSRLKEKPSPRRGIIARWMTGGVKAGTYARALAPAKGRELHRYKKKSERVERGENLSRVQVRFYGIAGEGREWVSEREPKAKRPTNVHDDYSFCRYACCLAHIKRFVWRN